ncbi:hypothetical protein [Clostridium ganghwense]|uniref:YoqO-like protein n=1 Tax=Clostridium ganghwense TaxID=312089 RepID=A0ABT4CRK8_9CLOT|nr:hypothetical protein [Clostridium ganghwense]MCY6370619.1 hypothetical protein [Clostridium ganghwense]
MKKNNIIAIVTVFILITAIRIIGIENIPFPMIVIILMLCMTVALLIALKYKGDKKERIYLLVMTILAILLFSILIIAVTIENNYPQISKQYKPIFITLMGILFLSLLITALINVAYKRNKHNKFKKK